MAVTILVTAFEPSFLINDDSALASLISGDYTGHRTSSLVVGPAMLGHVLRLGYAVLPNLPWYGIALYALQIIAWAAIGTVVFMHHRRPPLVDRVVVAAVILALAPWLILRISFTPTSLLLGVAGVIVFAAAALAPRRTGLTYAITGGLMLGSVYFVRANSFLAIVIVFAPVLAVIAFKAGVRRSTAFALTVGVLLVLGFGTNRLQTSRSAEWRAFTKLNNARKWLHDTPRLDDRNVTQQDLDRIGWTRNDLWLFSRFIYPDPNVYNADTISALAAASPPIRNDISPSRIYHVLRDSSDRGGKDRGPALGVLGIVAVLLALRWNRASALVTLASVAWFIAVLVALLLYVRLPGRVLVPLEAGATLLAAVVPAHLNPSPPRSGQRWPWTKTAILALVVLIAAGPAFRGIANTGRFSRENRRGVNSNQRALDRLTTLDPNGIYVGPGNLFGTFADPLSTDLPFANPRLIGLGWSTNSPLFKARLARLDIGDLYTALRTNPHVYLLGSKADAVHIARFYGQHRNISVHFRVIARSVPVTAFGSIDVWSAVTGRAG